MTLEWLLNYSWMTLEWLLNDSWMTLDDFWMTPECLEWLLLDSLEWLLSKYWRILLEYNLTIISKSGGGLQGSSVTEGSQHYHSATTASVATPTLGYLQLVGGDSGSGSNYEVPRYSHDASHNSQCGCGGGGGPHHSGINNIKKGQSRVIIGWLHVFYSRFTVSEFTIYAWKQLWFTSNNKIMIWWYIFFVT